MPLFSFRKKLPLIAFIVFGSTAVVLWHNENTHDRRAILRLTQTTAEQIRIRIQGLMNARMSSLELLAQRWVERTPPDFSRKRFLQFAEAFYEHYPGFLGINWIDPGGTIQWVFPEKENAQARGRSVFQHIDPKYVTAFKNMEGDGLQTVTPCVELFQGGMGYDAFWPLLHKGRVQGYLNGAFRIDRTMDVCLARDIVKDFRIRIQEEGRLIFQNGQWGKGGPRMRGLPVIRNITFPGKTWQLHLEPKKGVYPATGVWNLPLLFFGIIASAALSMLLHVLVHRLDLYKEARDSALHEVSERKKAEKALKENEQRLESLLRELEEKNTELETFVYTVSHDLKTPIVTVEGFVGAIREDFAEDLSEDADRYLKYISDAAKKMDSLISDLLELSRVGRLQERRETIDFEGIVHEALAALNPLILEKGIRVSVQEGMPSVHGEKKRLMQVMENLLSNSIKYMGEKNASPRIEIGVESVNGEQVFFVRDNGIGIEETYFEKIFQVFQRLPSAKRLNEGTGVGLAIVKRIIENHGGRIWLESEPGKGTTIFFTLGQGRHEDGL